jgi:hypothetical protein
MAPAGDSMESRQGPRVPWAGKPVDQGKGTGTEASPTLGSVAGLKMTVAEEALVQGVTPQPL